MFFLRSQLIVSCTIKHLTLHFIFSLYIVKIYFMRYFKVPISWSSTPAEPAGNVLRLYLSLIRSPGLLRVQNLDVWSLLPEHKICPNGCQANVQTMLSCACSIAPTSLSALVLRDIEINIKWKRKSLPERKQRYLPYMPEEYGTITTAAAEKTFVTWVPGNAGGFFLVTAESLYFLAQIPDIKQFQEMVSRCCDQPVTIFVPLDVHHGRFVRVQSGQGLAGLRIPQLDRLLIVFTAGND